MYTELWATEDDVESEEDRRLRRQERDSLESNSIDNAVRRLEDALAEPIEFNF